MLNSLNTLFKIIVIGTSVSSIVSCVSDSKETTHRFELLEADDTGLDFVNDLDVNLDVNILNYLYYYNGGGLASGDFNNDGWTDLYFTSNLGEDKMYLNRGEMRFEDVSDRTAIDAGEGGWTTGATVVDINSDGYLDIYVCQVGKYLDFDARNKLFICQGVDENGIPQYVEKAEEYGLAFQGFSTHAGFFDYDLDGDLDMYLLNHSVHQNSTYGKRSDFLGTFHELSGDRLYRNDNNYYRDVTKEVGIESSVIGYGLGLAFGDFNLDGYPDIYVANDFHENDYLYINQQDGTFEEELMEQMMHCSKFSMGCDVGDINNDVYPDVITLDMRPEDPEILKRSEGEESVSVFNFKLLYGYYYQYAMNCLQLNNGNETFSEIGRFAGIEATDWSWSPLIVDFDLDGYKDLFIANGIPKRANDIDYINYYATTPLTYKVRSNALDETDLGIIEMMPEIKLANKFYLNGRNNRFVDIGSDISNNLISYSNSAIYADLDNDGDYDIVSNNINEAPFVYKNHSGPNPVSIKVLLDGSEKNRNGIGSKVIAYAGGKSVYATEQYASRAFQSSMLGPIIIGNPDHHIDSVLVIWSDGRYEARIIGKDARVEEHTFTYSEGLDRFDYERLRLVSPIEIMDRAEEAGLRMEHLENDFVEFHRETLIPHRTSDHGPALAVGDLNGDGLDDVFLGSAKGDSPKLMYQMRSGRYTDVTDLLDIDPTYEQYEAIISDFDGDGLNDILIGNGGNEYFITSPQNRPQLFLGSRDGHLLEKTDVFDSVFVTTGAMVADDFDADGDVDIFIGGRAVPFNYGEIPRSYLLRNDGQGNFEDVTSSVAPGLDSIGMIKSALWYDINNDGANDLIVAVEWDGVFAYENQEGAWNKRTLTERRGLWNFIKPVDYDDDGDLDLLIGNTGRNTRWDASTEEPIRMYYADFDDNGSKEQIVTFYQQGREVPLAQLGDIHSRIPVIKKKYQYAKDFASASIEEIFGQEDIANAKCYEVDFLDNGVLLNQDNDYTLEALPEELQTTSYMDAATLNEEEWLLMIGNYSGSALGLGKYDADLGTVLIRDSSSTLLQKVRTPNLKLRGEPRKIRVIDIQGKKYLLVAFNNGYTQLLDIQLPSK